MNTLMHICCAPCANRPIAQLREEGFSIAGFWFNPNIHPYTEYQARKRTLEDYSKEEAAYAGGTWQAALEERDVLTVYTFAVHPERRGQGVGRAMLEFAARYAAENGYDSFTTSLLISPYQNHEAIAAAARAMGERYGVKFLYRDFRPLFQEGQQFAREHGFYMQKYCGCIFSEEDRYMAHKR